MNYYICKITAISDIILSRCNSVAIVNWPDRLPGSEFWIADSEYDNDHYLLYNLNTDDEVYVALIGTRYQHLGFDFDPELRKAIDPIWCRNEILRMQDRYSK